MASLQTKTRFIRGFLGEKAAQTLFAVLRDTLPWWPGAVVGGDLARMLYTVPGRGDQNIPKGFWDLVVRAAGAACFAESEILGVYISYSRTGNDHTPVHPRPGTIQAVLILGDARMVRAGSIDCQPANGDLAIFNPVSHGGAPASPWVRPDGAHISVTLLLRSGG